MENISIDMDGHICCDLCNEIFKRSFDCLICHKNTEFWGDCYDYVKGMDERFFEDECEHCDAIYSTDRENKVDGEYRWNISTNK